jgi:putative serine protease PepD
MTMTSPHTEPTPGQQAPADAEPGGNDATMAPRGPQSRRLSPWILAAGAAVIAVVGGVVGGVIVHATTNSSGSGASGADTRCPAVAVSDKVLPSVVTLSVSNGAAQGSGSGEIIRTGGYILTNDHVISAGAVGGTIDVLFSSGHTERATLVGRSVAWDLAVVKVQDTGDLPVITIGRSESVRVGQPVVALGAPLGLSGTVTSGIVSALGRDVSVPVSGGETARLPGAIQTDASINPGNSGGALVDCSGRLVGINTAIATVPTASGEAGGGSVGIGFAIPVDLATVVADQLINTGRFVPLATGLVTTPIPRSVADEAHTENGLFVQTVSPGGPAAQAGLRPGDIIISADGKPTSTPDSVLLATLQKRVGDKLRVEYLRSGQTQTATLTLAAGQP